jgi:hypothetical protein
LCIYLFSKFISKKQIDIYETYTNVPEVTNTDAVPDTGATADEGATADTSEPDSATITLPKITKESTIDELVIADSPSFPHNEHVFVFLSSINHTENMSNNELKWYDNFIDVTTVVKTDFNKGSYFSMSSPVLFTNDKLLPYSKGADLSHTSLTGPVALYFANDKNNFMLTEFSVIFMMKIKNVTKQCNIFEMLCNTSAETNAHSFVPQAIALSISRSDPTSLNFTVTVGSSSFTIKDIDHNTIINDVIHAITLTYDGKLVKLFIDEREYSNSIINVEEISLGSAPVIVNKAPELDCIMYSFAYYKKALSKADITDFRKYVTYYISGNDILIRQQLEYLKLLKISSKRTQESVKKLQDVSKLLNKCNTDSGVKDMQILSPLIAPKPSQM